MTGIPRRRGVCKVTIGRPDIRFVERAWRTEPEMIAQSEPAG